jgi:hypothetical protein
MSAAPSTFGFASIAALKATWNSPLPTDGRSRSTSDFMFSLYSILFSVRVGGISAGLLVQISCGLRYR